MTRGDVTLSFFFLNVKISVTGGVLAQSPEPEADDKVLNNSPD